MNEYDHFLRAQALLQRRFNRVSGRGLNLLSLLPNPKTARAVLVGGARNPSGAIPASTRQGIDAALKSAVRAEIRLQKAMSR